MRLAVDGIGLSLGLGLVRALSWFILVQGRALNPKP